MSRQTIDDYLKDGRCRIIREQLGERDTQYVLTCAGAFVGSMTVTRMTNQRLCHAEKSLTCSRAFGRSVNGRGDARVRLVEHIRVNEVGRRRGIATKLYETAAKDACRAGEPLVSAYRVKDAHSNDFWAKQKRKGRATVVGVRHDAGAKIPVYALDCAKGTDLSGLGRMHKGEGRSKLDRAIVEATKRGYRVNAKGQVIGPTGNVRKCRVRATSKSRYAHCAFNLRVAGEVIPIPFARLAAYQKHGAKALQGGVVTRHRNDNALDNRPTNISIGTRRQNALDIPKKTRVARARHAAKKGRG